MYVAVGPPCDFNQFVHCLGVSPVDAKLWYEIMILFFEMNVAVQQCPFFIA